MAESVKIEPKGKKGSKKFRPTNFTLEDIKSRVARRTTSLMWEAENDPFQVFEVEHESCLDFEIVVKNGEHITKGFYKDLIDIPDPYVVMKIPGSSNSSKRTSHVDNNVNPIWDETFHFYLDPKREHTLHITLMDANHLQDEILGTECLDISMLVQNVATEFTFEFPGGSKVNTVLTLQINKHPDLRFSLSLCEEEKKFLRQRRLKVLLQMQKLLGNRAPQGKHEVPIMAVLGSGGGFRAMSCFSAAVKVLHETGILGCSTYVSGLSGSSWFISTLYAHDKFPDITYSEIYEEIKESVTQNWKWNLMHSPRYVLDMMSKSRRGQPVSFTDIFGHLLGDVLLKGKKNKTLSEQKTIVEEGRVPLPLYTCLHAKESVSCRAFSEWIEFSPFEIGIAKYATFMKTEYFGSKFLVGKLIKQFPELPLHYLQGVWGSAFTILMKRLAFDGGSKQDIVQMMRDVTEERAMHEKLESQYLEDDSEPHMVEKDSSTDDEADVEGADDKLSEEENEEHKNATFEADIAEIKRLSIKNNADSKGKKSEPLKEGKEEKENETENGNMGNPSILIESGSPNFMKTDVEIHKKDNNKGNKVIKKGFSFDFVRNNFDFQRKNSHDDTNQRKISSQSDPGTDYQPRTNLSVRNERLQRRGAIKESKKESTATSNFWKDKRMKRKTQKEKKCSFIQNWMKSSGVLNSRAGRAGEILNPFRGLSLRNSFPISPFSTGTDGEDEEDVSDTDGIGLRCRYQALDNTAKKLFIVDSGLAFNSPYPLLLRPQRAVDMYLSFDFSQRPSDRHMPFKELLLAEKWAQQNQVVFPPIEKLAREFSMDPEVKELYVFKDPDDPFCPVILHFTLVNNKFKWYKAPGVQRETTDEIDFADFSLFDDPNQPYASTNFVYEPLQYERLFKLVEYNTLICIDQIKEEIAEIVEKKRNMSSKSIENTFVKMQKVLHACKRFQRKGNLSLRINEDQRKQFMLACKAADFSNKSNSTELSSSYEESPTVFFDASDSFDWLEEDGSDVDELEEEKFEVVDEIDREIAQENDQENSHSVEDSAPKISTDGDQENSRIVEDSARKISLENDQENFRSDRDSVRESNQDNDQEDAQSIKIITQKSGLECDQDVRKVKEITRGLDQETDKLHKCDKTIPRESNMRSDENTKTIVRQYSQETTLEANEVTDKDVNEEITSVTNEDVSEVALRVEKIEVEEENNQAYETARQMAQKSLETSSENELRFSKSNQFEDRSQCIEQNSLSENKLSEKDREKVNKKSFKNDNQFSKNLERKEDDGSPLHMVQNLTAVI